MEKGKGGTKGEGLRGRENERRGEEREERLEGNSRDLDVFKRS